MKKWGLISAIIAVSIIAVSAVYFQAQPGQIMPPTANGIERAKVTIDKDYGKMPLAFIPNQGQMDKQVYFYVQGKDKSVYFTSAGLTYSLNASGGSAARTPYKESLLKNLSRSPALRGLDPTKTFDNERKLKDSSQSQQRWVVKLDFVGARENVKPECLEKSGTLISYFKGKPDEWQTGLQAAAKIIYRELWPGIDLIYYGTVNRMKYEFVVRPGANPTQIKLAYRGAESVKENNLGQLEIQTPQGGFFDDAPAAWQEIAGKRREVSLKYAIEKDDKIQDSRVVTYGFTVGKYDSTQTLILDPAVIVYCGYIGGSGDDRGHTIAADSSGFAYITGQTNYGETTFPVTIGPDLTYNGNGDAFVAKIRADGTGLVYCGYIGGSSDDYGNGISVDESGSAYMTGYTGSTETTFPVTVGPDLTYNGGYETFVAKVKTDGTGLVYCGYIGGSGKDVALELAVDDSGCAYVTGYTNSMETTFPVIGGPGLTYNGGEYDAFVAKVKADGTGVDYCGYIGGSSDDYGGVIVVDTMGCTYIAGTTGSNETTFPVTNGPDLTYNGGWEDAFVAKVKADGSGLVYCGYIGDSSYDYGDGIAVDSSGCAYIVGYTLFTTVTMFPVIGGPDLTHNGGWDAFIAKINASGTALDYCGYIGGSGNDWALGITVDDSGCAYVTGRTDSLQTTFPVTGGNYMTYNGGEYDTFVAKIKADGTSLDICGYIGGSDSEEGRGIAIDTLGFVYVTGKVYSDQTTFPVTVGPDLTHNGGWDAFIVKISVNYTVNFAAGNGGTLVGITTQTVDYGNDCTQVEAVPNENYQFVNWTGTGGFVTTTDNPLTVTNVTTDMMITAHFVFSNPAGWVPVENLQNNMIVYGKAYNGNYPAAVGDWIGAFGPGGVSDCRGTAAVKTDGNYYLTVYSDENSGESITFKLWPLPAGPAIDGSETISFIDNGLYNGLPLHFGPRGQNIALANGWNWISFNVLPGDTSLNSVFGGLAGAVEQIKSQTQAAVYSAGSWIGDLADMSGIADGIMYKVKTNQDCAFNTTGSTIPFNQSLPLIVGWNWSAYLPTLNQLVDAAVNSIIIPVSQIKSQYKSVIKIGSSLFGDLIEMEPNKGYTISMNDAGMLVYPYGVSAEPPAGKTASLKIPTVEWPLIPGNQYNMVAYGKIFFEGKAVDTPGYYLASSGPAGEKDGRSLSPVNADGSYFSTIRGNTDGEVINFKLIDSGVMGKNYSVLGSLVFQSDELAADFDLKTRSVRVTAPNSGQALYMGAICDITWAAYEVNMLKIELYKSGKSLLTIAPSVPASAGTYSWTIPARMTGGIDFKVKISCIDAGVIAKDLSAAFSILPTASLVLNSPNGGQVWQAGRSYDVTWGSSGINNLKIELYKASVLYFVITENIPAATGKFTWAIPAGQPVGSDYKIKVSSIDVGNILSDDSDSMFSIAAYKHVHGDFNDDGKSDLLWRYYDVGGYNCLWLVGTAPAGSALDDPRLDAQAVVIQAETDLNRKIVGSGDFNGDGKEDILWGSQVDGSNAVWFMNGAVCTGTAQLAAEPDSALTIRGAGDFNSDGKVDILWRNLIDGSNKVWLMDGTVKVSEAQLDSETDLAWDIYGTGDFDSDGRVDILWRNNAAGSNRVWLMKGTKFIKAELLSASVNLDLEIVGVGDYDGNEKPDILWRNKVNGRIKVWLMDGLARLGSTTLTQVTNLTWKIDN